MSDSGPPDGVPWASGGGRENLEVGGLADAPLCLGVLLNKRGCGHGTVTASRSVLQWRTESGP